MWGRFDDLRAGTAVVFSATDRVLQAERPEDVAGVLQEVQEATQAGAWAFGHVSYEAGAGLQPGQPGRWEAGAMPLVCFGLGGQPTPVPPVSGTGSTSVALSQWRLDWSDVEHADAVARVREHIAAGETYQVNLTDRCRATVEGDPQALYRRLALAQRGSYNAYLELGEQVVASASPELFFEWVGDRIRTRPMKGTAARGRTTAEDVEQARALRTSSKERAENLMIVDLLRNDLGRIAQVGSVSVDELFCLERYPTVWQLTSQISARPRAETGLLDVFRALFPCGSVTGAPKRRTMQLIDQLEPTPRGVYCGAIGVVAPPTARVRARFSVAIRTAVVDRRRGVAEYGVGGGITWSSDPARERAELHAKAAVLTHDVAEHQLLETMAYRPGAGLRNRDRHLARLADSADYFGFSLDLDHVRQHLDAAVAGRSCPARVRLLLDRDGRATVQLSALDQVPALVRLAVDDDPVDASSPWLQHKTTQRSVYEERAARHPDVDDVVLVNAQGEVTETTRASIAARVHGRWWTPPTTSGCLPGVERGRLLEQGLLSERVLHLGDLHDAEELAVISSLRGWRRARLAAEAPQRVVDGSAGHDRGRERGRSSPA